MNRVVFAAWIVVACLGSPTSARAFTEPRSYFDMPQNGGGGGRWFTGSPAEGYGCSVCHTGPGSEPLELEGLPLDGYVPGQTYDIRVAWPDFAERAAERRDAGGEPRMSIVAELVTETGEGSGVLEIATAEDAEDGELCVVPEDMQAAQLFVVRPGEDTVEQETRCEATGLGQRRLVAVLACGASELRVRWTAPEQWQDGIYFSAGFVATEDVSGDPEGDHVTELLQLLPPAASTDTRPETTLGADCSVVAAGRRGARAVLAPLCVLGLWLASRRRRRT